MRTEGIERNVARRIAVAPGLSPDGTAACGERSGGAEDGPPPEEGMHEMQKLQVAGAIVAGFLITVVAVACASAVSTSASPAKSNDDAPAASSSKPKKAESSLTSDQENAKASAEQYLAMSAFSEKGLIQQLTMGDGYSKEDATFAVKALDDVDWNEQAAKSAEQYLQMTSFSRSGLVQQLTMGDGYTPAQAAYGVKKAY